MKEIFVIWLCVLFGLITVYLNFVYTMQIIERNGYSGAKTMFNYKYKRLQKDYVELQKGYDQLWELWHREFDEKIKLITENSLLKRSLGIVKYPEDDPPSNDFTQE